MSEVPGETVLTESKPSETKPAETTTTAAETKPAETKPDETKVEPLTLASLKVADGLKLDEPLANEFLTLMNNDALKPGERAQALLDLYSKTAQAASEKSSAQWEEMQNQWTENAKKEFGDKLDSNLGTIAKLIDAFAGKPEQQTELREVMDTTGAGNHPAMIRFLSAMASKLVVEGSFVPGNPGEQPRSAADILFPNQGKAA